MAKAARWASLVRLPAAPMTWRQLVDRVDEDVQSELASFAQRELEQELRIFVGRGQRQRLIDVEAGAQAQVAARRAIAPASRLATQPPPHRVVEHRLE